MRLDRACLPLTASRNRARQDEIPEGSGIAVNARVVLSSQTMSRRVDVLDDDDEDTGCMSGLSVLVPCSKFRTVFFAVRESAVQQMFRFNPCIVVLLSLLLTR